MKARLARLAGLCRAGRAGRADKGGLAGKDGRTGKAGKSQIEPKTLGVGSSFACKYFNRMKVTDRDKHSSL